MDLDERDDDSRYSDIITLNVRYIRSIMNGLVPARAPIVDSQEVAECLSEANCCFEAECYVACSVMMRKAVEVAVTKKFLQTRNELSLAKKLVYLVEIMPSIKPDAEGIGIVKWFGDKGAHDPRTQIWVSEEKRGNSPAWMNTRHWRHWSAKTLALRSISTNLWELTLLPPGDPYGNISPFLY